jgi:hypothetical protein
MRSRVTRRQAALLYAVVFVAFFGGTWALDRFHRAPFQPGWAAGMALCLVAGWWVARRIVSLLSRRGRRSRSR